jgi:hypothetical protein
MNPSLSTNSVLAPDLAAEIAAHEPADPAPTTMTSKRSATRPLVTGPPP